MQNNEKNFQNQENIVQNTNEQNVNKDDKNQKKLTIVLIILVIVLLLAVTIGGGVLLSKNVTSIKEQKNAAVINLSKNNIIDDKNTEKLSKKIDESKTLVYTADYCKSNANKKAYGLYAGEEFNSNTYLIAPYINIDSEYAEKANEEIKKMYDDLYKNYGEKTTGGVSKAGELKYEYGSTDKILSVAIICREGVTNAGWSKDYVIYNINLETLKEASFEDVYKECGFESADQLSEKIKITLENDKESIESDNTWDSSKDKYFMNSNKEFNIIVMGHMGPINLAVRPNVERLPEDIRDAEIVNTLTASGWAGSSMNKIRLYSNGDAYHLTYNGNGETEDCIISRELLAKNVDSIEEKTKKGQGFEGIVLKGKNMKIVKENVDSWIIYEKTSEEISYFEQNKNLNYTSNSKDSVNGKVAIIKMGEKVFQKEKKDGYYIYTDNFNNKYYIKEITNITSEYKMTGKDNWANLFKAVIEYVDNNNSKKSFDTAVIIPKDVSQAYIYGPYDDYTGSTSFVKGFTDLYKEN